MEALRERARPAHRCRRHRSLKLDSKTTKLVTKKAYDAYGKLTATTPSTAAPARLGYAGQYTDAETGFQYLRARYMTRPRGSS